MKKFICENRSVIRTLVILSYVLFVLGSIIGTAFGVISKLWMTSVLVSLLVIGIWALILAAISVVSIAIEEDKHRKC